jgi:WD40 repeat protein
LSADGRTLSTVTGDGTAPSPPFRWRYILRQWDVGTVRVLHEVRIETPNPHPGTFSLDGRLFLGENGEDKVRLWDVAAAKPPLDIAQALNYVTPFALSGDGNTLAVLGQDGDLYVYDPTTGKERRRFRCGDEDRLCCGYSGPALSPDGRTLVASTLDSLRVWDASTGKLKGEIEGCRGLVASSADGKVLACADRRAIRLLDAESLREVRRFEEHHDEIKSLAFSADGRLLVTGQSHSVGLWDVATGKPRNAPPGHRGSVLSLAFAPDGKTLVSGAGDGTALVWDLSTGTPRYTLAGHCFATISLAVSPDGKLLATGDGLYVNSSVEAQVRLWRLDDGRLVQKFTGHLSGVASLAFSPDGRLLASGGGDARFRVWDPATGKRLYQVRGDDGRRSVGFSPDGRVLLAASTHGELCLYEPATGECLRDFGHGGLGHGHVLHASFLPDGKTVVSDEWEGPERRVRFWDSTGGTEDRSFALKGTYSPNDHAFSGYAVSPDGTLVATAVDDPGDPAIRLLDAATGRVLAVLRGHTGLVTALAFSPDGKTLASASHDTTVLLWDVPRARLLGPWFRLCGAWADEEAAKQLAAHPEEAVAFLRERLVPVAVREARYVPLAWALDDDRFAVREQASRRLERAAAEAEPVLQLVLAENPPPELRTRAQSVLDRLAAARAEEVAHLTADLDGPNSEEARRRLLALGPAVGPALRRYLDPSPVAPPNGQGVLPPQNRGMVEQILEGLQEPANSVLPLTPAGFAPRRGGPGADRDSRGASGPGRAGQGAATGPAGPGCTGRPPAPGPAPESPLSGRRGAMTVRSGMLLAVLGGLAAAPGARAQELKERAPLKGHTEAVYAVAFSPDGMLLASACQGYAQPTNTRWGEIRLWDVARGREVATFRGHPEGIGRLAFSPDGQVLATASSDGVKLWSVASPGKELATRSGIAPPLCCLAFSADGKKLGAAGASAVCVWDMGSVKVLSSFTRRVPGWWAAFGPDLTMIASPDYEDVDLWDVAAGRERLALLDHRGSVHRVAFSGDGKTLVVASCRMGEGRAWFGEVRLWDLPAGKERTTWKTRVGFVRELALSGDGKTLAMLGEKLINTADELELLDAATGRLLGAFSFKRDRIGARCLAFSQDGKHVAVGCDDSTVRLWDVVPPAAK